MSLSFVVLLIVIVFAAVVVCYRSVQVVRPQTAVIVERLGRYHRTLAPGRTMIMPLVDHVRSRIDLREQVVHFPPHPIVLADNTVVRIDWMVYFQVTDDRAATYEIANLVMGIEQLTVTMLRNIGADMDLERMSASRSEIAIELRKQIEDVIHRWGVQVNRVDLKAIDPVDNP